MGTRADFYVGMGKDAEWLGSIAYDGHPGNYKAIEQASTEDAYRQAVQHELKSRDDATFSSEGWPWPWEDSQLTDYAYTFHEGQVYYTTFRKKMTVQVGEEGSKVWLEVNTHLDEDGYYLTYHSVAIFPNMKERQRVKLPGMPGSGTMVLQRK